MGIHRANHTYVISHGIQALKGETDTGILAHYAKAVEWLRDAGVMPPCVVTGELELTTLMPYICPKVLAPRIGYLGEMLDYCLGNHQSCPEVKLGAGYGAPLQAAPLLQDKFVSSDFNGAVVHFATHIIFNMLVLYEECLGKAPIPRNDYVSSRPNTEFGHLYRYFWAGDVGPYVEELGKKMATATAMIIAVLQDWPIARLLTTDHWDALCERIEPINLDVFPWYDLRVAPFSSRRRHFSRRIDAVSKVIQGD